MKIGMKIVYVILFLSIYIFLINAIKEPHESYSIFAMILFIPTAFVAAWAIPQLFKDAVVPLFNRLTKFFNWLAKFIPKSGD